MKTILITIVIMTLAGCAFNKRVPPDPITYKYLCKTGLTNEPAIMYDCMTEVVFALGVYDKTTTIPLKNGDTFITDTHVDTTGFKEAFKWGLDVAVDAGKQAGGIF